MEYTKIIHMASELRELNSAVFMLVDEKTTNPHIEFRVPDNKDGQLKLHNTMKLTSLNRDLNIAIAPVIQQYISEMETSLTNSIIPLRMNSDIEDIEVIDEVDNKDPTSNITSNYSKSDSDDLPW